jgi:serine/threonine-protein phosphatase 6 regulatory ankyrin repeat subunit A/serine/threonine-protein phosphatase 6 regulatory ankyrin repeat subunit B
MIDRTELSSLVSNTTVFFRCLLDTGNVDVMKADKQGRTAVHYAAIYGSTSCLKVFKKCKVDLMVTDENGATPAHHAAAGGNLECLKFLIKIGSMLDRKDNNGKTSAHYVRINKYNLLPSHKASVNYCGLRLGSTKRINRMSALVAGARGRWQFNGW